MQRDGEYTLRLVADRRSHFARVGLSLSPVPPGSAAASVSVACREPDLLPSWQDAARAGVALAINENPVDARITKIQGTLSDTLDSTVWCAAVLAAFRALNIELAARPDFHGGVWTIILSNGNRLTR